MNILRRIFGGRKQAKRTYALQTQAGRLGADWITAQLTANEELRYSLRNYRDKAREREQNDDWVRRYLGMVENNIVGANGILLKMQVVDVGGKPDKYANREIQTAWYDWAKNCTPTGQTWTQFLSLCVRTVARDGECIVRFHRAYANKYQFAVSVLEGDYCDETYCETLNGGARIVNGVEVNGYGVPVAYWCYQQHPGDLVGKTSRERVRVGTDDMLLVFRQERPGQLRGMSWLASGLQTLKMLDGYAEACLIGARAGACKGGFYKRPAGEQYTGDVDTDGTPISEAEPGHYEILPKGWEFEKYDPNQPNGEFAPFNKAILRKFCGGVGVSYASFSSDLEAVNMSSMRGGMQEEREGWRLEQERFINLLCRPVFAAWLEMYLMSGLSKLPFAKLDKFRADTWQGRKWGWIDPVNDLQAEALLVSNKWKTNTAVVNELPGDDGLEEVYAGLSAEQAAQKEAGLTPGVTASLNSPAPAEQKKGPQDAAKN